MKHWLIAGLLAASLESAYAQQQIEWKQTLNMPKGQNVARDRADILGIEFGDTYAEAKAKLEALHAEIAPKKVQQPQSSQVGKTQPRFPLDTPFTAMPDPPAGPPIEEGTRIFQMQQPGAATILTASYVAKLVLRRTLPGSGSQPISETITVHLSAPSSGQQVIGMERLISYPQPDQPRVSDIMAQMKAKYKADPKVFPVGFSFEWDNGQPVGAIRRSEADRCAPSLGDHDTLESVQRINSEGRCDVVLSVVAHRGISQDHAALLTFSYADNDRIKANRLADYAYLQDYIRFLQDRTRGQVPKL